MIEIDTQSWRRAETRGGEEVKVLGDMNTSRLQSRRAATTNHRNIASKGPAGGSMYQTFVKTIATRYLRFNYRESYTLNFYLLKVTIIAFTRYTNALVHRMVPAMFEVGRGDLRIKTEITCINKEISQLESRDNKFQYINN